jgi:hypothetical protein
VPVDPRRRRVRTVLRSPRRVIALAVVVAALTLTATAVIGSQPSEPEPIPESAFRLVSLPPDSNVAGPVAVAPASPAARQGSNELAELRDPAFATEPPERAQPDVQRPNPIVVPIPTPTPRPQPNTGGSAGSGSGSNTTRSLRGNASWYCRAGISPCTVNYPDTSGFQAYAAAGPKLRAALGSGWRGNIVYVDGIRVKLIDWCQCYKGEPHEKLLDLYYDVFARTGSPVTIRW